MERLKTALENLDEAISGLEERIGLDNGNRRELARKQGEEIKSIRAREANSLSNAQKIASRLDNAIEHVESILRH